MGNCRKINSPKPLVNRENEYFGYKYSEGLQTESDDPKALIEIFLSLTNVNRHSNYSIEVLISENSPYLNSKREISSISFQNLGSTNVKKESENIIFEKSFVFK